MDAGAARSGQALRHRRHQPALEGRAGNHRRTHVLRLRLHRQGQAERIFLPGRDWSNAPPIRFPSRAAQPRLDLSILKALPTKTVLVGVIDLGDETVESADIVAERLRAAAQGTAA